MWPPSLCLVSLQYGAFDAGAYTACVRRAFYQNIAPPGLGVPGTRSIAILSDRPPAAGEPLGAAVLPIPVTVFLGGPSGLCPIAPAGCAGPLPDMSVAIGAGSPPGPATPPTPPPTPAPTASPSTSPPPRTPTLIATSPGATGYIAACLRVSLPIDPGVTALRPLLEVVVTFGPTAPGPGDVLRVNPDPTLECSYGPVTADPGGPPAAGCPLCAGLTVLGSGTPTLTVRAPTGSAPPALFTSCLRRVVFGSTAAPGELYEQLQAAASLVHDATV